MVRCFIAVFPIEEKILEKVFNIQKEISKFIKGKPVEKENMHITISFLGELNEKQIQTISEKLKNVTAKLKKREALVEKIKLIPNKGFIRVIALDVLNLEDVSEEIEKNTGGEINPAHLTLFRVKSVLDKRKLLEYCERVSINESFVVKDLKLMKSTLTPKGPIYEVLDSFTLAD